MALARYSAVALFLPLAFAAGAQSITLVDPGNVPLVGSSYLVNKAAYLAPVAGGAGMNYDFSGMTSTETLTYMWAAPTVSPNAGMFPNATLALTNGGPDTVFYRTTTLGLERVGETRTITALGDNFPAGYTDGVLEMPLPVTYGDTWTDPIAGSFSLGGNPATRSGTITGSADAYGTVLLPGGTDPIEVLRLNSYVDETINTSVSGFPVAIHHTRHVVAYVPLWGKIPVFRTVTDTLAAFGTFQTDNFTEWLDASAVGITDLHADPFKLRIFPNPANSVAEVAFEGITAGALMEVVDMRGATVLHTALGSAGAAPATERIDVSQWDAGLYQLVLTDAKGTRSTRRFAVAR